MEDFIEMITTGCSCLTKTPEASYHKEDCKYRIAWEAYWENKCKEIEGVSGKLTVGDIEHKLLND